MNMIILQLQILILLGIGYWFGKKKWITRKGASQLNFLVMNLILPASIFKSFETKLTYDIVSSSFFILVYSLIIQAVAILISRLVWLWVKDHGKRANLEYGTMSNNSGTLGMVIAEAAFGSEGVLFASIYVLPVRVLMWSYGIALYSKEEASDWKQLLKKVVFHPCLIAIVLGLIYMFAHSYGFEMPAVADKVISSLAGCNTVLIMLVIGVVLSEIPVRSLMDSKVWLYCALRLVGFPLLAWGLFSLFGIGGIAMKVCVLELAMPAPVTMNLLADKYHCDGAFSSKMIFLSTLLSMISLPLWTVILA